MPANNAPFVDHYIALELNFDASPSDIKKAYHKKALAFHPDRNSAADADEKTKKIIAAWEILGDPIKKFSYDEQYRIYKKHQSPLVVTDVDIANFPDISDRSNEFYYWRDCKKNRPEFKVNPSKIYTEKSRAKAAEGFEELKELIKKHRDTDSLVEEFRNKFGINKEQTHSYPIYQHKAQMQTFFSNFVSKITEPTIETKETKQDSLSPNSRRRS